MRFPIKAEPDLRINVEKKVNVWDVKARGRNFACPVHSQEEGNCSYQRIVPQYIQRMLDLFKIESSHPECGLVKIYDL